MGYLERFGLLSFCNTEALHSLCSTANAPTYKHLPREESALGEIHNRWECPCPQKRLG